VVAGAAATLLWLRPRAARPVPAPAYVGSASCRECHAPFYQKWATSWHGLAMQPYSATLAAQVPSLTTGLVISNARYRVDIRPEAGTVIEQSNGQQHRYPIRYATGGKNVQFFLTELDRGRLQVLPVAYDVRRREWYDMAGMAMRHFRDVPEHPYHWRDRVFTFNTACYHCHVSQLTQNYDPATDTYRTTWTEPGINCETCHGPGQAHVALFQNLPAGAPPPADLQILVTKTFTHDQMNSACAPCHAKMTPITASYPPGAPFHDHFDLNTLEDRDWYPDGRDLGENFTELTWRLNPCRASGKLDCVRCHTASGRYRFAGETTNQACLPCHATADHAHHAPGSPGSKCVNCHMPMTEFARMRRSDHSFRPPNPAATLAFGSPNACNLCHTNQSAQWAADRVAAWHPNPARREQELQRARLIDAARKQDWSQLPAMLAFITDNSQNEIFAAGLIRLLAACPDDRVGPACRAALRATSPLVRARAAEALAGRRDAESIAGLVHACSDSVRLVRIRAAQSLAGVPLRDPAVERATAELLAGWRARPDDAAAHYNLGNFFLAQNQPAEAVNAFTIALRIEPDNLLALVNSALAHNAVGDNTRAEINLRRAHTLAPTNPVVNLNLGLLLGELGKLDEAEQAFQTAWQSDTNNAVAAYNLGVLLARKNPAESLRWCRRAMAAAPHEPQYAYTVAFYEYQQGRLTEAVRILHELIDRQPVLADAFGLLGQIYENQGNRRAARDIYQQAVAQPGLTDEERAHFARRLAALSAPGS